ncbi:MAG: peptidyl-prolyl cis-trans isomerase [Azoarcus sp.]|nr:peptidyl-prolyl cis-trans isomerase [Azoarcus sp.]
MIRHLAATLALSFAALAAHAANPQVELKTNKGDIVLELDAELAPKTVANFLQYVKSGQYDGTIFHRVIDGFMIQGGGMDKDMNEKPTRAPIENEAQNGLKNTRGTVAMARTSAPHSATAQFFINVADNAFLDYPGQDGWGYAVFGKVVLGQDVVQKIAKLPTRNVGPHGNVPTEAVIIESARVLELPPEPESEPAPPVKPEKPAAKPARKK